MVSMQQGCELVTSVVGPVEKRQIGLLCSASTAKVANGRWDEEGV